MVSLPFSPPLSPQAAITTATASAAINPARRFIVTSLNKDPFDFTSFARFEGEPQSGAPVAPGERARPLIEPAILRDHLRRAHDAETETAGSDQDHVGDEIVVRRQEFAVEQRIVEEAHGCGKQRHIEEHPPERLPAARETASREEGGPAAEDHRQHEEDE